MSGTQFAILLVLLVLDLAGTMLLLLRQILPSAEERSERRVERAMQAAEKEAPDPMDEGFENIMRFSVNGRTGFDLD